MTNSQFKKVSRPDVDRILTHGVFQKAQLSLNILNTQKVIKVKLATLSQDLGKKVYVLPQEVEELRDKACAFSFKIGTQMYFFKSTIKFNSRGFFVEAPRDRVYELARRKNIRFDSHSKYPVFCSVVVSQDGRAKVTGELLNISSAGASLRLGQDSSLFKKNQSVHILLKPEHTAGFSVQAKVRYAKGYSGKPTEVGFEFEELDAVQNNRINLICEELSFYIFAR